VTVYHAKYFAHELTKRCASDSVEKLAAVLSDAQVDLNPHQIEAALFAFRSPLSKGAILADEVGLGKTIEAGIVGILRAVDLDNDFLDVAVESHAVHVLGLGDTMDDVIGPMVNKRVKVIAGREAKGSLRLRDIELDE